MKRTMHWGIVAVALVVATLYVGWAVGYVQIPAGVGGEAVMDQAKSGAVPTYTLSADNWFGMLAMVAIASLLRDLRENKSSKVNAKCSEFAELDAKVREFELWEETHREQKATRKAN